MNIDKIKNFGSIGISVTGVKYPFVKEEMDELKKLLVENLVMVFPKINYTKEQYYELSTNLGTVWKYGLNENEKTTYKGGYVDDNGYPLLLGLDKVTAKRDADGKVDGLPNGGTKVFNWHCAEAKRDSINGVELPLADFVGLQGVRGTEGSITQVCQMIDRYELETPEKKQELKDTIMNWGFVEGDDAILPEWGQFDEYKEAVQKELGIARALSKQQSLVQVAVNGKEGLHFSPSQIVGIVGQDNEKYQKLKDYIMKEYITDKYIYNHEWQDGDIFYMDQKVCIHRRTDANKNVAGLTLEQLEKRLLHRIEVYPDSRNPYAELKQKQGEAVYES